MQNIIDNSGDLQVTHLQRPTILKKLKVIFAMITLRTHLRGKLIFKLLRVHILASILTFINNIYEL